MSLTCRILIAIPAFRRPQGLARLLAAIDRMAVPGDVALSIVVIDNSPEGSVRAIVAAHRGTQPGYVHLPTPGLAKVRNAALDAALDQKADWLGFIDDDEWPEPGWLIAHLRSLRQTGATASLGPVRPVFAGRPPGWVLRGGYLASPPHADGGELTEGYSSNILFSLVPVCRAGLRFDDRFDRSGGEDTAFFDAFRRAGGRIVFCLGAPVREDVPDSRLRLGWHCRRWRRTGHTNAVLRRDGGLSRAGCLGRGALRMGVGLIWAAAGGLLSPLSTRPGWVGGIRVAARGLGYVDAARGRTSHLYGTAAGAATALRAATPSATTRKSEISCGR